MEVVLTKKEYDNLWRKLKKGELYSTVFINRRKDGGLYTEEKTISPIKDEQGNIVKYLSTSKDVSEKLKIEEKLKKFKEQEEINKTRAILKGQDSERKRLSRDLHDGIGQILSITKRKLEEIKDSTQNEGGDVDLEKNFEVAVSQINDVIDGVRKISQNLMPSVLEDFGLKAGLKKLCETSESKDTKINFSYSGSEHRKTNDIELMLYRIAQEAINNALKYSKASTINVMFYISEMGDVKLIIADDGCGFDTSLVNDGRGSGLKNIEERAKVIDAKYSISSIFNTGTIITVEL